MSSFSIILAVSCEFSLKVSKLLNLLSFFKKIRSWLAMRAKFGALSESVDRNAKKNCSQKILFKLKVEFSICYKPKVVFTLMPRVQT